MVIKMEIIVDGYKIAYKITGKGTDTVVILQGWGTELALYDSVAKCIESKYRVIQFDFPGFGDSEEPREVWSVDDYANFFLKLMEGLGIEKAILVGHSYGGRVIIKLAAREQMTFDMQKIVLVDSAGVIPKKSLIQKMKVARYKILKKVINIKWIHALCPEGIEEWKNRQGSADYRNASPVMRQCLVKAVNEDLSGLFEKVDKEVLLIWGENDTATPVSDGYLMEKMMPNAGLAVIKNAGHFCFVDQPIIFGNIMKSYFGMGD